MIHGNMLMTAQLMAAGLSREDVMSATGISRATYYRYAKDKRVLDYLAERGTEAPVREEAIEALRRAVRRGSVPAIRLALTETDPTRQEPTQPDRPIVTILDDIPDLTTALRTMVQKYGKDDTLHLIQRELDTICGPPSGPPAPLPGSCPLANSAIHEG